MTERAVLTINDLPPAPLGKTGWPWTVQSDPLPELMPDGSEWPRISIVTPSFNQGQFIEETIRSVLLQNYPNLEYIIIDGGSTDNTIDVIKKYHSCITYWVSEKDRGQANAINKGLAKCSGEIFNWINSDDYLAKNCLSTVSRGIKGFDAFAGGVLNTENERSWLVQSHGLSPKDLILGSPKTIFHQPGVWLKTKNISQCGGIEETLNFCFDWDLIIRYLTDFSTVNYTPETLSNFRFHKESKTTRFCDLYGLERHVILMKLLANSKYGSLHNEIDLSMRRTKWHDSLRPILERRESYKISPVFSICINSLLDIEARWDRFTLGAIKRLLLHQYD
jgi:glycosyltransferase involved in cell wall biosynthesis